MNDDVSASRREALRQLERIEMDEAYVGLIDQEDEDLDRRERRQVREYVAGVTRWRRWLDFVLGRLYHGDYGDVELRLRQILRLGAYELLFTHTPSHAAIYENVELAKQMIRPGAGRLVNGMLRTLDRDREHIPDPDSGDRANDLAIRYSHPTWVVRRWLDRYGEEDTAELLEWNNRRPMYSVRANPQKTTIDAFTERLDELDAVWVDSPYLDDFVRMKRLQPLIKEGLLDEGLCAVQDESAGLVVRLLDPQPGETIIDGCAGPGGKATYAAERMQGEGRLIAIDVNDKRVGLVEESAAAQGVDDLIETWTGELQTAPDDPDLPRADRVLVDAPCSGLGVLAKRADLRWQRDPEDLDELTALQRELLDAAAKLVKPGGLLVYSTCTIEPEENEAQVTAFLERHDDFQLESAEDVLPAEFVTEEGYFASTPQQHGIDGAFGARLRRAE
jgi:16S rRNA (cytosine967-C5)-methyltransferase